jgi:hypothetical protein
MPTKDTAPIATVSPTLPPVPGGGSWRPNASGDGWVENLPAEAETATPFIAPFLETISQE